MKNYVIRTATREDILDVYGKMNFPCRAWAVDYFGATVAVAGVSFQSNCAVTFSAIVDGVNIPKITIYRCALDLMNKIKSLNSVIETIEKVLGAL